MLLATESALSSTVSVRDISDCSPFCNIPFNQHNVADDSSGTPYEPAKISVAMTKTFAAMNGGRVAASTRELDLIEQSLRIGAIPVVRNPWSNTRMIKKCCLTVLLGDENN